MKRSIVTALAALLCAGGAWAGSFKVLILIGDARTQEPPLVEENAKVGAHSFEFEQVIIEGGEFDGDMRDADIVYFPWNGPGHDGSYYMAESADAFRDWVEAGGAVYVAAFDDNYTDPDGNQVGAWMPIDDHPVLVQNTGDSDVNITAEGDASGLFSDPNDVNMNAITLDDNFAALDDDWVILAERADNGEPAACYLPHGAGVYLEVCADTRDGGRAAAAEPLYGNILFFLANYVDSSLDVDAAGKLTTTWGALRAR